MITRYFNTTKCLVSSLIFFTASTPILMAGVGEKSEVMPESANPGDWCSWLGGNPGTLYKNKQNPYIQELRIFGRFHWQYAYVDGEGSHLGGSRKFSYDTEEIRRFRLGAKIKFLNYFSAHVSANFENDQSPRGGDRDIEYFDLYSSTIDLNVRKALDLKFFDELNISIGKQKTSNSAEHFISSRYIKTVERSSLSNYVTPPSSTGISIRSSFKGWDVDLGMFSGDLEKEFSRFDNDYFYTLRTGYKFDDPSFADKFRITLSLAINGNEKENAVSNPESAGSFNQKWVASLSTKSRWGRLHLLTDIIAGDNGTDYSIDNLGRPENNPEREGHFWGVVIMPSYWLIEDRLEAVFRYQYAAASEAEGFRISSRYARVAGNVHEFAGANDLSNGRGDSHHSAYLGMNYYLCEDNAKLMVGVEYDDLDSGSQDVYEGFSAWAAFRMYF